MKKKMMKRLMAMSLSLMLASVMVPVNVFATEADSHKAALVERGGVLESETETETETETQIQTLTVSSPSKISIAVPTAESSFTYGRQEARSIVIKNEGTDPVNITKIALAGTNKDNFELDDSDLKSHNNLYTINGGIEYRKITIKPKTGADVNSYKVAIVLTEESLAETTAEVDLTINKVVLVPKVDEVESKTYDKKKAAEGTLTLTAKDTADQGIVKEEKPTAKGTFEFENASVEKNKKVTVKDIVLDDKFKTNYELSATELKDLVKSTAEIKKASRAKLPKKITIASNYYNAITVKLVKGQEYSIDDGKTWNSTGKFTNLTANKEYTIITRIAAATNYKASKKADWKTEKVTTPRTPIVSSTTSNTITGITANSTYKISTTLSFGAKGAGMENTSPSLDDVRYVPISWKVVSSSSTSSTTMGSGSWSTWTGTTNAANFSISTAGTYKLEVTFKRQVHNGTVWEDTSVTDIKDITFLTSSTGTTQTNNTSNRGTSSVARTGDSAPIIILCILLVLSIGVIAVYLVKRKGNK